MKDNNKYTNSPITKTKFRNKTIYIKRDDLLDESFSGNKARKFYYFFSQRFSKYKKKLLDTVLHKLTLYTLYQF